MIGSVFEMSLVASAAQNRVATTQEVQHQSLVVLIKTHIDIDHHTMEHQLGKLATQTQLILHVLEYNRNTTSTSKTTIITLIRLPS